MKLKPLRYDNEKRVIDQVNNTLANTEDALNKTHAILKQCLTNANVSLGDVARSLENYGLKTIEIVTPLVKTATWATSVFAYTTIANTIISALSFIGKIGISGYTASKKIKIANDLKNNATETMQKVSDNFNRAVNVLEIEGEKIGNAATSGSESFAIISQTAHEVGTSCQRLTIIACVGILATVGICFRNSVCATNPDSLFCAGPSWSTILLTGTGLLALSYWICRATPIQNETTLFPDVTTSEKWERSYAYWEQNRQIREEIFARNVNCK